MTIRSFSRSVPPLLAILISSCGPWSDYEGPPTLGPPPGSAGASDFSLVFDSTDGTQLALPSSGTVTALIDVNATDGLGGKVTLVVSGFPNGTWGTLSTYSAPVGSQVLLTAHSSYASPESATITVTAYGASTSHAATFALVVAGGSAGDFAVSFDSSDGSVLSLPTTGTATAQIDLTALHGFTGDVNVSASGFPKGTWGTLSGSYVAIGTPVTLTAHSSWAGPSSATITVTASGVTGTHVAMFPLLVAGGATADFAVSFDSSDGTALTLPTSGTLTTLIDVTALQGFEGMVNLTVSGFPNGTWGILSQTDVAAGTQVTLRVSAASAAPVTSMLTVTGTGSTGTHTATIPLVVSGGAGADFAISFDPVDGTELVLSSTGTTIAQLDITAVQGFSGDVSLAVSGFPAGTSGALSLSEAAVGTSVDLTVTSSRAPPSTSVITVTATGATGTHSASLPLVVSGGSH